VAVGLRAQLVDGGEDGLAQGRRGLGLGGVRAAAHVAGGGRAASVGATAGGGRHPAATKP
jgi:hypothetical protein